MGNHAKSDLKPTTKNPVKKKPADTVKSDAEKKAKAKFKPRKITNSAQVPPPKPARRRPTKPYFLNVLYPKQKDILKAITGGMDTRLIFRDHLIKAKLFKEDGENLFLVPPKARKRNRPGTNCENPAQLLEKLVLTLSTYFAFQYKTKGKVEEILKLEFQLAEAVATIRGMRAAFKKIGVKEKSFDSVCKKLEGWKKKWMNYRINRLSTPRFDDLKAMLFNSIKQMTKFSDLEIFLFISQLWIYFGFAVGTKEKVKNRQKFEYYSAGGKEIIEKVSLLMYSPSPFLP